MLYQPSRSTETPTVKPHQALESDGIAEAAGGDQASRGAGALDQRVRRLRGAVAEGDDTAEQLVGLDALAVGCQRRWH